MSEHAAATCRYCHRPIEVGSATVNCRFCSGPHHAACWAENGGCAVEGCPGGPHRSSAEGTASAPFAPAAATVGPEPSAGEAYAVPPRRSRNPVDRLTTGLPKSWRITIDWLVTIVGAILIVLAIKQWVINPYRIPSSSMEPTLHCARPAAGCESGFSDRVLACRFCYRLWDPKRGDVIVFNTPPRAAQDCGSGGVFVKRLIGLPGDTWAERSGYVYINGKRLDESYVRPERRDSETHGPRKIPPGEYFMMGDNRAGSCDSRRWGTVARGALIGKVIATYWPPSRISIR